MDKSTKADRNTVALPGLCMRVDLPTPPNYLPSRGGGVVFIGDLESHDAALLGMAMLRQTVSHWHARWAQAKHLSPSEARHVPCDALVYDGMVRVIASNTGAPADMVRTILTEYITEVTRYE